MSTVEIAILFVFNIKKKNSVCFFWEGAGEEIIRLFIYLLSNRGAGY